MYGTQAKAFELLVDELVSMSNQVTKHPHYLCDASLAGSSGLYLLYVFVVFISWEAVLGEAQRRPCG